MTFAKTGRQVLNPPALIADNKHKAPYMTIYSELFVEIKYVVGEALGGTAPPNGMPPHRISAEIVWPGESIKANGHLHAP